MDRAEKKDKGNFPAAKSLSIWKKPKSYLTCPFWFLIFHCFL